MSRATFTTASPGSSVRTAAATAHVVSAPLLPYAQNTQYGARQSVGFQHNGAMLLPLHAGASANAPLSQGTRPIDVPQTTSAAAALAHINYSYAAYVYYLGVATAALAHQHASNLAGPAPALPQLPAPHPQPSASLHTQNQQPRQHVPGHGHGHTRMNSMQSNASLGSASSTSSVGTLLWDHDRDLTDTPRTPDTCSTELMLDADDDEWTTLERLPKCVAETPIDATSSSTLVTKDAAVTNAATLSLVGLHALPPVTTPPVQTTPPPAARPETPLMARAIREAWWSAAGADSDAVELPWFTLAKQYPNSSFHRRIEPHADATWWECVTHEREIISRRVRTLPPTAPHSTPILPPPTAIQARARRITVPFPGLKINTRVQQCRNGGGTGRRRGSNASTAQNAGAGGKRGRSDSVVILPASPPSHARA